MHNKKPILLIVILVCGIVIYTFTKNESYSVTIDNTIENMQKAIIASADAYWDRGVYIQYESRLKTYKRPEDATEDNVQYGTCNTFTYDVYKDALGIATPLNSLKVRSYYRKEENKNDVHLIVGIDRQNYYLDNIVDGKYQYDETGYNNEIKSAFLNKTILKKLQPGDMIAYINHISSEDNRDVDRHVQMVYSLIYDESGNVTDAWLIHGWSGGIDNNATENRVSRYDVNKVEGTVQKIRFNDFFASHMTAIYGLNIYNSNYLTAFYVIRPFADGKTWKFDNQQESVDISETNDLKITAAAIDRLNYPNIYISKTSNYKNNTVVPINSSLKYLVTIKNGSNQAYNGITVVEDVPSETEYISCTDSCTTVVQNGKVVKVKWSGVTVASNSQKVLTYTVKTPNTIGQEIIATGKVNNIPTTKVKNICGNNFTDDEIATLASSIRSTTTSNVGFKFVNDVYKKVFDIDLGISNLKTKDILDDENNMMALKRMETLLHNDNQYDLYRKGVAYYDRDNTLKLYNTARIREINLYPGQIILTSRDDEQMAYIYLNGKLITKTAQGIVEYSNVDDILKGLFFADGVKDASGYYSQYNKYLVKNIVLSPANLLKFGNTKVTFDKNYLDAANNLTSYSTNKYLYSNTLQLDSKEFIEDSASSSGYHVKYTINGGNGGPYYVIQRKDNIIVPGKTYTSIVELKANKRVYLSIGQQQGGAKNVTVNTDWKRVATTYVAEDNQYASFKFYLAQGSFEPDTEIYIRSLQLVEGDGSLNESINLPSLSKLQGHLSNLTRSGYTFKGWYTKPVDGELVNDDTIIPNGDVTYYAHWQINKYTIGYNLDGGIVTNPVSYNVETATFKLTSPTKEGYTFIGWTGSNGTTPQRTVTITKGSTGNKTYTANWEVSIGYYIDNYDIRGIYIKKINKLTSTTDFKNNISLDSGYTVEVDNKDNIIYTGGKTKIYKNGNLDVEFTNIVSGDTTGDGKVTVVDVAKLFQHYRKTNVIPSNQNYYILAGDVQNDNEIKLTDVAKLFQYVRGKISSLD